MRRLTWLALIAALTLQGPPSSAGQEAAEAPPAEDLSALPIDDLIERLPAAGCEWRRDAGRPDGVVDPASVELERRLAAGEQLTDEQWRSALLSTGALRFRPRWPRDEPYGVSMTVPRWLGIAQIRLRPRAAGLRGAAVGELVRGFSGTVPAIRAREARAGQPMGRVPDDATELVIDVEVERGRSWLDFDGDELKPPPAMFWQGTIRVPVELVEDVGAISDAVDNDAVRTAVRDAIGAGFRLWGGEPRPVPFLVIDPDCVQFPDLERIGLSLRVELLEHGKVIAASRLVAADLDELALVNSISRARKRFYGSTNLEVPTDEADTSAWVLRLTGTSDHIRFLWHAEQWWNGTITIPWTEAVAHETARVAPGGRGPEVSTPHWR